MTDYLRKCHKYKQGNNYLGDPTSELSLTIASFGDNLCLFECRLIKALASGVYAKFNLTLEANPGGFDVIEHFKKPNMDCVMARWPISETFVSFAHGQWIKDEYNLVILSALYTKQPNIAIMMNAFQTIVWILIALSVCVVSQVHYIECKLKGEHKSLGMVFFETCGHLVNQIKPERKRSFLLGMWSLIALLIANVFSSGILSAVISTESVSINSMTDLIKSNQKAYIANVSEIWWMFENHDKYNVTLTPELAQLRKANRIEWVPQEGPYPIDQKPLFKDVGKRSFVYMSYYSAIFDRKYINLEYNLEISNEKGFPALIAFPVAKNHTKSRQLLLKILNIMVESGINVEMEEMSKLGIIMEGHNLYDDYRNRTNSSHHQDEASDIKFELIIVLLISLCTCLAFCLAVFLLELIVFNSYNSEKRLDKHKNYNYNRRKHYVQPNLINQSLHQY